MFDPLKYPKLTPTEVAQLHQFEQQQALRMVNAQHIQKQGGLKNMAQKARATETLQRQNMHGGNTK